ncbi:MAG: OmpP1/FadL family transporter [Gammaproteobacteria bacterium]
MALPTALLLTMSQQALAAGFQITEQTITGLGRGFAASGIAGDDVGDLFYNPAGIVLQPKYNLQAGGTFITAGTEFDNRGSNQELLTATGFVTVPSTGSGDDGGKNALVPNIYYTMDLNPQLKFGVGVTAPFGLATEYSREWIGRYHAVESELKTIDVIPTLAYRVSPYVTLGAGVIAQYAEATLSQAVFVPGAGDAFAEVTGDDFSFGYNLGVMIEPTSTTRLGLAFRSKVRQEIEGDRTVSGTPGGARDGVVDASANVDLPETIYAGFVHELLPKWDLLLGARWTRWSRLPELRISFADGSPDAVTPLRWENSWTLSVGTRYDISSHWTLRAGYIYDESPVPGPQFRTPRVPDSDRNWATFGVSYTWSGWTIDFGYAHIFFDDARVDIETNLVSTVPGAFTDNLIGFYDAPNADLFGLGVQYRF